MKEYKTAVKLISKLFRNIFSIAFDEKPHHVETSGEREFSARQCSFWHCILFQTTFKRKEQTVINRGKFTKENRFRITTIIKSCLVGN